MSEPIKEKINPRTGKPFSKKFIEQMEKHKDLFKGPRNAEWSKKQSETIKKMHAKTKTFRELATMMLEMAPKPEIVEKIKEFLPGLEEKEITNRVAMLQRAIEQALNGNLAAFQIIRDTAGEKPVDKQEVTGAVANTYVQLNKEELKDTLIEVKNILNELE